MENLVGRSKSRIPRWLTVLPLVSAASYPSTARIADLASCLAARPSSRWEVPGLREASGLALAADGRLLVHGDETGRIIAIDPAGGRVVGQFQLGATPPRQDFEGIAVADSLGYLITSNGTLYEFVVPPAGTATATLAYTAIPTVAGASCEIEGLAYQPAGKLLLFGCKHMKQSTEETAVFRWSVAGRRLAKPDRVTVDQSGAAGKGRGKLNITGLEIDPRSGDWLLLSSLDRAIAIADPNGRVRSIDRLGSGHRQPEGIAMSANGTLYLADEGGKGLSTISAYACQ